MIRSMSRRACTWPKPQCPSAASKAGVSRSTVKSAFETTSAFFERIEIKRNPHHAVRVVPAQVGTDEADADDLCFVRRHSASAEQGRGKVSQNMRSNRRHGSWARF